MNKKTMSYFFIFLSFALFFSACAPSFPKDETHKDKKPKECFECHSTIDDETIPKNHLDDDGELLEARQDCFKCHKSK